MIWNLHLLAPERAGIEKGYFSNFMFKIDLHVHSVFSGDSTIQPEEIVSHAVAAGLDAVCITEHESYSLSEPFQEVSRKTHFPVFLAVEYRALEGHLLIFGVKVGAADLFPRLTMQKAVDWVHSRGGVAVPAHPYEISMTGSSLGDEVLKLRGLIALETVNGSLSEEANLKAGVAAAQLGIRGIGGSDAHGIQALGKAYTAFPEPIRTMDELVSALRRGGYTACRNNGRNNGPEVRARIWNGK